jgi:hypothetical protein
VLYAPFSKGGRGQELHSWRLGWAGSGMESLAKMCFWGSWQASLFGARLASAAQGQHRQLAVVGVQACSRLSVSSGPAALSNYALGSR